MKLTLRDKPLLEECTVRSVVLVNGTYYLFEEQAHYPLMWTIHKRESSDGFNWSLRSVSLFKRGDFDKLGQADPTVIYDDGTWKMWFDALKSGKPDIWESIGYAVSLDGDRWIKIGDVLSVGKDFDSAFIHHPCVVRHEGTYYMFYAGSDCTDYRNMKIGLATSVNGIKWEKQGVIMSQGDDFDSINVRPSAPILINGLWYMYYWGFNGTSRAIGLATSLDLIHWTKKGKVFGSPVGKKTEVDPTASSVMFVPPNTVRMWYAGYTGNRDMITHSSLNYAEIKI